MSSRLSADSSLNRRLCQRPLLPPVPVPLPQLAVQSRLALRLLQLYSVLAFPRRLRNGTDHAAPGAAESRRTVSRAPSDMPPALLQDTTVASLLAHLLLQLDALVSICEEVGR